MRFNLFKSILASAIVLAALSACSAQEARRDPSAEPPPRDFSEEDKAAARALSIANSTRIAENSLLNDEDDPYMQALICRNSLQGLVELLRTSGAISDTQINAIEETIALFHRRAAALGESAGKTPANIEQDLRKIEQNSYGTEARGKTALACLQRLKQEQS